MLDCTIMRILDRSIMVGAQFGFLYTGCTVTVYTSCVYSVHFLYTVH